MLRPFQVGPEPVNPIEAEHSRMGRIAQAVLAFSDDEVTAELALVDKDFTDRHWRTREIYLERFNQLAPKLGLSPDLSPARRELIGAYFCHEYSYASAALMNPAIVPHPDQSGLRPGELRIVLSLRAVGEGHISSVLFREAVVDADGGFIMTPPRNFSVALQPESISSAVTVARRFADTPLSGTVIFPMTPEQRGGLEDLRLTDFTEADGSRTYYGTYTAYSGRDIRSELLVTKDFETFELRALTGSAARNKGMALFPRQIDGQYAMIGRQDGENIFYLTSPDLTDWGEGDLLIAPKYAWELVQMGNCGPPIELDEGWLLLTHGVGPMRKYAIGAALLDKADPRKVLGRSRLPLLSPQDEEREGYVPNVVYTCGALLLLGTSGRKLFVPYGIADSSVAFSWIDVDALLASLK